MAMYYLEEPDAVLLPREGVSQSDMRELVPGPAWIVISVYEPSAGDRTQHFEAAGQLRAYFANRIAEPNHTVNVYYYTPSGPADHGSPAAFPRSPGRSAPDTRASSPGHARRDQVLDAAPHRSKSRPSLRGDRIFDGIGSERRRELHAISPAEPRRTARLYFARAE